MEDILMGKKIKTGIYPDSNGHFGPYGGRYVGETLMPALLELEEAYGRITQDEKFKNELYYLLEKYAGRPTPLFLAKRLTEHLKGASIFLKREDLAHTGAHKINNTLGQALLAKWMEKKKVIAIPYYTWANRGKSEMQVWLPISINEVKINY